MTHTVTIWRNPSTLQWHHRFTHTNGRVLAVQSEGVTKRSRALQSATLAYGLDGIYRTPTGFDCLRGDVRVAVER